MARVSIIIPTMAEARRHQSLLRAIQSIREASAEPVDIVVVVNGGRRAPAVVDSLRAQPDVRLLSQDTGSAPLAALAGRRAVTTPFYGFLDDDDELLPGGIDLRLAPMLADERLGLVVSNGLRRVAGQDSPCFQDLHRVADAPFEALFQQNWMASCSALFRSAQVGSAFFEDPHPFVEWTWLAFRLCVAGVPVATVEAPTFRIHDTPQSASKSVAYAQSIVALYERMLASGPPPAIRGTVRRRIGAALHDQADDLRRQGRRGAAWQAHLRSLCYPGGWRYLSFSRHLLRGQG